VETVTLLTGQLFGRMRVTVDDRPPIVEWPRPTARRLVALLLLAPDHVCSRSRLLEQLFSHLEPARAARALSKALSMARVALDEGRSGPSLLAADRDNLWIADRVRVEVDVLEHLALLEGTVPLAGTASVERLRAALHESRPVLVEDTYEEWAMEVADGVERARGRARLLLARASGAEPDWRAVVAADPANEEACTVLVELQLRAGRRREAMLSLETCRVALERLGVPLPPELAALDVPPPAPSRRVLWPLFGREREYVRLLDAVAGTPAGTGTAVLVAGITGIGKTHLLRHVLAQLAEDGWTVAMGAAVRDDRVAPFAALRTALLPHLSEAAAPLITRLLLPDAGGTRPPWPVPTADVAVIADAIRHHLDAMAEQRPVVLCIDDLQWTDGALQAVLGRLAADVPGRRWSLLLAARTDEPEAPIPELPTSTLRVSLHVLDREASNRLAVHATEQAGLEVDEWTSEVAERGRGHPFFTVELARTRSASVGGATGVPERIIELLRRRVARCSPAARRLTAFVAIAGDDATTGLVANAVGPLLGPAADLADVLDELDRAALVHSDQERVWLSHPLLRDAAVSTLNVVRRAQLHARVADALEAEVARPAGSRVLAVARHRLAAFQASHAAGLAPAAASAGLTAAALAQHLGAPEAAEELHRMALEAYDSLDDAERSTLRPEAFQGWLALGGMRMDGGSYGRAEEAAEAAWELATWPDEHGRVWWLRAEIAYHRGDLEAGMRILDEGLRDLPEDAEVARARLLAELGWCHLRRAEPEVALSTLRGAVELAYDAGDWTVLTAALDRYAFALASTGSLAESLVLYERAEAASQRSSNRHEQAVVRMHHGVARYWNGEYDDALTKLGEAADLCERHGLVYDRSVVHWGRAWVEEARGEPGLALAERDAELRLLEQLGNDRNLAGCQAHRAVLLRLLGRCEASERAATAARAAAARVGDPVLKEEVGRALSAG
jgi:DNA-binding SARP family transcriptional activator/tetratricopeptide (TPR) repeat protein